MRLACQYLNQTHFLIQILNSRGSETNETYLYAIVKPEVWSKPVWFTKCVWLTKGVWLVST